MSTNVCLLNHSQRHSMKIGAPIWLATDIYILTNEMSIGDMRCAGYMVVHLDRPESGWSACH